MNPGIANNHATVSSFVIIVDSHWREPKRPKHSGDFICHNDAAPYNAIWVADSREPYLSDPSTDRAGVGFIDWNIAAPQPLILDLAFAASSWVPLHAHEVAISKDFEKFDDRPRKLRLLLDSYE